MYRMVLTNKSEEDEHNDLLAEQGSHIAGPADLLVSAPGAARPRQQVASANKTHRSLREKGGQNHCKAFENRSPTKTEDHYDLALCHTIV
jgi:hypothetical protein